MTVQPAADFPQRAEQRRAGILGRISDWIPVLILAYPILITPFLLGMSGEETEEANIIASKSNAVNQLFWIGLFGLTLISAGPRLRRVLAALRNPVTLALLAYLALALLSVFWSPVPGIALRRSVQQIIIVLSLVISVSCTDDARALFGRTLLLLNAVVLVNCLAVAFLPPTPLGHAGIYPQKNGLGAVMALAVMFNIYGLMTTTGAAKRVCIVLFSALAFALLVLSQSKTSLGLSILMPVAAYLLVSMALLFRINALTLLVFFTITGAVLWLFASTLTRFGFSDLSLLLFNDETYTGRTFIWSFVLDIISRAPILGQGYASFWATGSDSIAFREAPGFVILLIQAHNGYLDVMLETGLVGFSLLFVLILSALAAVARIVPLDRQVAFISLCLLLFVICHNMLESSWYRSYSLNWLFFLMAALMPGALLRASQSGQRAGPPGTDRNG
ncbi:MAG: hypothetical protein Tsb0019_18240 [Roseibium sp.]